MIYIKRFLISFLLLLLIWLGLTGFGDLQEWLTGSIIAFLLTLIFWKSTWIFGEIQFSPRAVLYWFIYPFVFLRELIKSNLDVASRVLNPKLPISPGIVRVKTKLKSRLGRIVLANSITLTPGTLTVETNGENYYIHWIDVSRGDVEGATREIVGKFEKYLEVIFG